MKDIQACNFWSELGDAYCAFSVLSDEGDWQSIIQQVAAIATYNAGTALSILDYGSGVGTTAASIRRRLYGEHGLLSSWSLYDPDCFARKASSFNLPAVSNEFSVTILDKVPGAASVDIVLFVHTTYYIARFDEELDKVFSTLLKRDGGQVLCVAMPRTSPFFVKGLNNMHNWTAEMIVDSARRKGLKSDVIKMRSRFRWLPDINADHLLSRLITSFVCGRRVVTKEEVSLTRSALIGEIDFGDWLVVIGR